jgi:hypothetical protein
MPLWDQFFRKDRYDLSLVTDPGVKKLSRYEIRKLQAIARRHMDDDEWALSQLTHDFPEWQKNNPGSSTRPIPWQDTFEAMGLGNVAQETLEEANEKNQMDKLVRR